MSNQPNISQDDLLDVKELTEKLECAITDILQGNEHNLALSALMSASINAIIKQCDSFSEIETSFGVFNHVLNGTLQNIINNYLGKKP